MKAQTSPYRIILPSKVITCTCPMIAWDGMHPDSLFSIRALGDHSSLVQCDKHQLAITEL